MEINIPEFIFRLQEGKEIISPKVDFAFKKFFGSEENKDFLVDFLQSLLDIPKDEYDEVTFENTAFLKEYDKDKYGVLDILVKTKTKKVIHIEIQVGDNLFFRERALYYLSRLVTEQITKGNYYASISKTISILVLNYELIHDSMKYKNVYHFCDLQNKSIFSDKLEIITLELPKIPLETTSDEKEQRLISWLEFIKVEKKMDAIQIVEKYPYLQKAYDKIQELSRDPEDSVEYTQRLISYYDEIGRLMRDDLMKEESERRLEECRKIGLEEGRKKGMEQGIEQVAKKALQEGFDIAIIEKLTGLNKEAIERFR